jgi:hypothetical protein
MCVHVRGLGIISNGCVCIEVSSVTSQHIPDKQIVS